MMSEEEVEAVALKPCPFCGSEPVAIPSGGKIGLMIECISDTHCPHPHVSFIPPSAAIAAWNTRVQPLEDTEEGLREALAKIKAGSRLGKEMFEQRVRERKGRLTWWAVNVLQANLDACFGTADKALSAPPSPDSHSSTMRGD